MEFQGAKYHIYNRYPNCDTYICKTYRQGYYESSLGYALFKSEIKSQISNVNPTGESIDQLAANTWRQLPVDRRAYYDHKANESGVTKPLKYPCTGVLRFKRVNGQTLLSEDGLISYRPHSEQLSVLSDEPIGLLKLCQISNQLSLPLKVPVLCNECSPWTDCRSRLQSTI